MASMGKVVQRGVGLRLSVCSHFRNEGRYLREWIEFHRMMGVEKFYLYNRRSTDDWRTVLAPYMEQGIVDVKEWDRPAFPPGRNSQIDAFQDCIDRLRGQESWLAFLDGDQFLWSPGGTSLADVLDALPPRWGAVVAYWMCFGSSGKTEWEDAPVIERFTWRPEESCGWNQWFQSIVRLNDPSLSTQGHDHLFRTAGGTYNESGALVRGTDQPQFRSLLRVNHYWTKSRAEWEERQPADWSGETYGRYEERWREVQGMDVDDREIQRFLPALKARLQ